MTRPYYIYVFPRRGPSIRRYRYLIAAWFAWLYLGPVLGYTARLYDVRSNRRIASS